MAIFLLLLTALLGLTGCGSTNLDFPSEYQAVYLDNGQIFFGKLAEAGSPSPSCGTPSLSRPRRTGIKRRPRIS